MSTQQIIFWMVLLLVSYRAFISYRRIWRNIHLGRSYDPKGSVARRWSNLLLIAFGQKKMFKSFLPAFFHLCIYLAFLLTQIELVEIILDGISGRHRILAPFFGTFYTFLINFIELLSLLALVATLIFLWRRNVKKIERFRKKELQGWPLRDANLILIGEIILIIGIFLMNGADQILQDRPAQGYSETGTLWISASLISPLLAGVEDARLILLERFGWWLHVLVVFGFILYLPISKHLHIVLAFPNIYFASQNSPGAMKNMPEVMKEVRSMLGIAENSATESMNEIPSFGAKDVTDLTWKNLLDAYTCTECGRCTAQCPANITGKKLSPRKVMMDVRDRIEEVAKQRAVAGEENNRSWVPENGRDLFSYITPEEIHACTNCQACIEACPVLINPMEIIQEMRRYEILTLSAGPGDWLPMFNSLENSGSVWQVNQDRESWLNT